MDYARAELRFQGGWTREVLVEGLAAGQVRGIVIEPNSLTVTHTLVSPSRARKATPALKLVSELSSSLVPGSVTLEGMPVLMSDKVKVGSISAVWCDRATGRVMDVLVARGGGFLSRSQEYIVPATAIRGVGHHQMLLSNGFPVGEAWVPYRSDSALVGDIRDLLPLHVSPLAARHVHVEAHEGQVHLSGQLATQAEVDAAVGQVGKVIGVRGLINDLIAHESLAGRVEQSLGIITGERAHDTHVRVLAEHGIVYLDGDVPTSDLSKSLESAAKSVTGVQVVLNRLDVKQ